MPWRGSRLYMGPFLHTQSMGSGLTRIVLEEEWSKCYWRVILVFCYTRKRRLGDIIPLPIKIGGRLRKPLLLRMMITKMMIVLLKQIACYGMHDELLIRAFILKRKNGYQDLFEWVDTCLLMVRFVSPWYLSLQQFPCCFGRGWIKVKMLWWIISTGLEQILPAVTTLMLQSWMARW